MDENKKELIELIIDKLRDLEQFQNRLLDVLKTETAGECEIDQTFTIGFVGIPLILGEAETDYLDDILYEYITKKITKKKYFKLLNEYLEGE